MTLVERPATRSSGDRIKSLWSLLGGALLGTGVRLVYSGPPGHAYESMESSFVLLVPIAVGAFAVYLAERSGRRRWSSYFWIGAGANALFVLGTFAILIEGLICVVLAMPLFSLLGGIGGLIMGAICRWTRRATPAAYSVAVLPLLLGGLGPQLPVVQEESTVTRTLRVSSTPERVWRHLVIAERIRPDEMGSAWIYRIGVPLPESAITESSGRGQVRHITMGRGVHFDQVAEDWQPYRRIRWVYRFANDSFPPGALDDHVRIGGTYFDVLDTEYTLHKVTGGTELRVAMRYRVGTVFNWYAAPIARLLVGNFEDTALRFYAQRAIDTP